MLCQKCDSNQVIIYCFCWQLHLNESPNVWIKSAGLSPWRYRWVTDDSSTSLDACHRDVTGKSQMTHPHRLTLVTVTLQVSHRWLIYIAWRLSRWRYRWVTDDSSTSLDACHRDVTGKSQMTHPHRLTLLSRGQTKPVESNVRINMAFISVHGIICINSVYIYNIYMRRFVKVCHRNGWRIIIRHPLHEGELIVAMNCMKF